MVMLQHNFCFSGQLSQSAYPDLFLTTLDGGGEVVPAHRVVMAAVSDKLATLCREGGRVVVRNISFKLLEQVVRFIYSGKVDLDDVEDVGDVKDGMDMLKVKIVIENGDSDVMPKAKDSIKRNRECVMDRNENLVVENSFTLATESKVTKDTWSQSQKMIKIENPNIVHRNQDTPVTASDTTVDGSDEEVRMSFSNILDSFSDVELPERNSPPVKKAPLSPQAKKELQESKITCEYCDEILMYRTYRKHCMNQHPESPWNTRTTCGTCRNSIPAVSYKFHLELFGHEDAVVGQNVENEDMESQSSDFSEAKKTPKSLTKIPCDYCEEQVTLRAYVDHCKKLHSISDADERCRRKCYRCGAKVHIIAEKFHQEIYHPAKPRHTPGKPEPLKIVEHNKSLTRVACDFCCEKVVFAHFKGHVKNKHPEIAVEEQVKCGKCGVKLPKISFKFHRRIFHKSSKLQPQPISSNPTTPRLKLKFPQAKVPCTLCSVRIKPDNMPWHLKNIHGEDAGDDIGQSQAEVTGNGLSKDVSDDSKMESVCGDISDQDVAGEAPIGLEHRGEAELESTGFRISNEQLSSDSSF